MDRIYHICNLGRESITLGYQMDNKVRRIVIDCADWMVEYPGARIEGIAIPPKGDGYPIVLTMDGERAIWEIEATDTAYAGRGQLQLKLVGVDGEVKHSANACTVVLPSAYAQAGGEPPEVLKPWVDLVASSAPTITVIPITNSTQSGHYVWITDKNGGKMFPVKDGKPGSPGAPGANGRNAEVSLERFEAGDIIFDGTSFVESKTGGVKIDSSRYNAEGELISQTAVVYDGSFDGMLPMASVDALGGVKAQKSDWLVTKPVKITEDGFLVIEDKVTPSQPNAPADPPESGDDDESESAIPVITLERFEGTDGGRSGVTITVTSGEYAQSATVFDGEGSYKFFGLNPIDTTELDTPAYWSNFGAGYVRFNKKLLVDQPSQYGVMLTYGNGGVVYQEFNSSPNGPTYKRSGNADGWSSTGWRRTFDTAYPPSLSTTLDKAGVAADSKATGDAIAAERRAREDAVKSLKQEIIEELKNAGSGGGAIWYGKGVPPEGYELGIYIESEGDA